MTQRRTGVSQEVLARYGFAEPAVVRPIAQAAAAAPEKLGLFTAEKRQAFRLLTPRAVYLSTTPVLMWITTQPIAGGGVKQFGGNRGFRPLKIGSTGSWKDTATRLHDAIPHVRYSKARRIWLHRASDVPHLVKAASDMLTRAAEDGGYDVKLGSGLLNLGPELQLDRLLADLREEARYRQLVTWSDEELSALLDRALSFAKAKGITIVTQRGHGINHKGFVNLIDRLVQRDWRKQFT